MTDQETLFLLSDARRNIDQSMAVIRQIARYDPNIAKVAVPRMKRLAERQLRLEKKAQIQQPPEFGIWWTPLIAGGMALVGLTGYVFKHHEETSLERYKLESIEKCIQENTAAGMDRAEAARVCNEIFTGRSLTDTFKELSRTIMIASVAITGVYIILRWKK